MTRAYATVAVEPDTSTHDHAHGPNRYGVLPIGRRLDVDSSLRGRGVTVAFVDSGFTRHPDLDPETRLVALEDLSAAPSSPHATMPWQWHGTQTSTVAAGSGVLSGGVYRGLASEARVALVAVGERGRIRDEDIVRGIEWAIAHRERYDIRILNLSLGGDRDESYESSAVDRAAEAAVASGIVVIAAAGNAGCSDRPVPIPPANSPAVITVGGTNDHNRVGQPLDVYCSSFGRTVDGLLKPEIVAPAMWVAAPVPQGTDEYRRAVALSTLDGTPDAFLGDLPWTVWHEAGLPARLRDEPDVLRRIVAEQIAQNRIVAAHYQHVDGTSFAAPIVSSVVALMLEANPALTPAAVKDLLISTAVRLPYTPVERQGYGFINPRQAVELARRESHALGRELQMAPFCEPGVLVFSVHADDAREVGVAADFNGWHAARHPLARDTDGIWRGRIPGIASGTYRYKFVIDGDRWIEDPSNARRDPDGLGGYNSLVTVG